ncbi:head decoration protein [Adhaeribacter arboris]|uniref:Head decoration protein n=1 Tax=Adhaeribacter arboris TaxID=2072846 RepID=A0A2T2YF42_9BACT|nr:head decoration protein [Adhaeribacter arboris]PSR54127.1 head decoration protein [Adhaeribacter arboris]
MKLTNELKLGSNKISGLANGVNADEAVNKAQLDAAVQGYKWKEPVKAASTGNLTLSGAQTVDGVSLVAGDRVLVKNQSTGSANGIYIVATGAWTRATDYDATAELEGASVFVSQGTTLGNSNWQMTTDAPITLGTTALVWIQTGQGTSYTQSTGIIISGSTIAVDTAVVARKAAATIGNGTNTSFTVNHALNTTDVLVQVWETGGSKELVLVDAAVVDANNVSITFATAPASSAYRVVVQG